MGRRTLLSLVLSLIIATPVALAPVSSASAVEVLPEPLPTPTSMSTAVWTGEVAYLFGGFTNGSLLTDIVEVDPTNGTSRRLPTRLPTPRKLSASVWTGDAAYVIGGVGYDGDPLPDVVRFEPGQPIEARNDALPWGVRGVPAVWTGEHIYVFGNCLSSPTGQYDILRYDPDTNETEVLEDALPIPGAGSSAIWTGQEAYVFGGRLEEGFSDRIVRFVPGEGCQFMDARLPTPRFGTAAVWDGQRSYVLGGSTSLVCGPSECVPTEYSKEVLSFDPAVDEVRTFWGWLPTARDVRAAVWAEGRAYVLGGADKQGPIGEIVAVDPNAPFGQGDDELPLPVVVGLLAVGFTILVALIAWATRAWREPPSISGGPFQG